jgi:glutamate racemase
LSCILLFDSGIGGLSVFNNIKLALPYAEYHYFADHAAAPYGDKNDHWLDRQIIHLVTALNRSISPDLIVIACNTASTLSLQALREHISTPVIGVVPAIKTAADSPNSKLIGLLATPATINRPYINDLIIKYAKNKPVLSIGSTELVRLAEQKIAGKIASNDKIKSIIQPLLTARCDHIVLGCTHFPLLKEELESIAPNVTWIDSGKAIGLRVLQVLDKQNASQDMMRYFYSSGYIEKSLKTHLISLGFLHFSENHTVT